MVTEAPFRQRGRPRTGQEKPILAELGKPTIEGLLLNNIFDSEFIDNDYDNDMSGKLSMMYRRDGQAAGLARMITIPIRSGKINLMRPENGQGSREFDFIYEALFSTDKSIAMRHPLERVLATASRMLLDGWSPPEIVWKIVNNYVYVEKIAYRSIKTIKPKVDKNGELDYYVQDRQMLHLQEPFSRGDSRTEIIIPNQKILHFVHGYEWTSIFGRSLFLQAYYHFEKKHKLYYISHMASQIRALRLRVLQSPESASEEDIKKVMDAVSKLGFNTTINLPDGFELELPDLGAGTDTELLSLIQHHDVQMSKSVLSQVIDIGVEGRTGSFNLSDTHLDIFIMNLELISRRIADVINRDLIPRLIDWNFGTGLYPRIEFTPFDSTNRKFLTDLFTRIAGARVINVSPEFKSAIEQQVSEELKMDIDYDQIRQREIDTILAKQALEIKELEEKIRQMEAGTDMLEQGGQENNEENDQNEGGNGEDDR